MLPAGQPKFRRRPAARPSEILAAALEVFATRGFQGARLEEVAGRAGISKGALYLYFETKADLFRAVVTEAISPNLGRVQALAGLRICLQHKRAVDQDLVEVFCHLDMGKVGSAGHGSAGMFTHEGAHAQFAAAVPVQRRGVDIPPAVGPVGRQRVPGRGFGTMCATV